MLWYSEPDRAEALLKQAEAEVRERYHRYQQLAGLESTAGEEPVDE